MNEILLVEVFAANPLAFYECMDCEVIWGGMDNDRFAHRQKAVSHLTQEKANEYLKLASWVVQLQQQYGNLVHVRIIDVVSLEGVTKSAQYGLNAYPAVVVDHRCIYDAHSLDDAMEEIAAILRRATEPS